MRLSALPRTSWTCGGQGKVGVGWYQWRVRGGGRGLGTRTACPLHPHPNTPAHLAERAAANDHEPLKVRRRVPLPRRAGYLPLVRLVFGQGPGAGLVVGEGGEPRLELGAALRAVCQLLLAPAHLLLERSLRLLGALEAGASRRWRGRRPRLRRRRRWEGTRRRWSRHVKNDGVRGPL
jgi:hypothetical protein